MAKTSPAVARLTNALHTQPPASVCALPATVLDRLSEQVEAGRQRHLKVAEDATNKALKGVPLPVRSVIKKALT